MILQYNENSGRSRHPMRGIETQEYLYLYNPWSDGERKFATATTGTSTYRQMVKRANNDGQIKARLNLFDHRVVEELYNVGQDPDCLVNLIDDAAHRTERNQLREQLAVELSRINDPIAPLVAVIDDVTLRQKYMAAEDQRSIRSKQERKKGRKPK